MTAAAPIAPINAAVGSAAYPSARMETGMRVAVGTMPEVKGALVAELAPAKTGSWVALATSGSAVVARGLMTLHVHVSCDFFQGE
jgi:hypothetical protein